MWMDYTINQAGENFTVLGDWEGEVMGQPKNADGTCVKTNVLYRPGDVFRVNDDGWLIKISDANGPCRTRNED